MLPIGNATLQVRFYRLLVFKDPTAKIAFRRHYLRGHCLSSFRISAVFLVANSTAKALSNE
jgi:hypothetical protein